MKKEYDNRLDIVEQRNYKVISTDKYIIGKTLGKGAYADVKLVTDKITKIDYAMKIYKKKEKQHQKMVLLFFIPINDIISWLFL